jgi:hypothetical protein
VDAEALGRSHSFRCLVTAWNSNPSLSWNPSYSLGGARTHTSAPSFLKSSRLALGSHTYDLSFSQSLTYQGKNCVVYEDLVSAQVGRSESNFWFWSVGSTVPIPVIDKLTPRDLADEHWLVR